MHHLLWRYCQLLLLLLHACSGCCLPLQGNLLCRCRLADAQHGPLWGRQRSAQLRQASLQLCHGQRCMGRGLRVLPAGWRQAHILGVCVPSCWRPCLSLQLRWPCGGDANGIRACCCLCHWCQAWAGPGIMWCCASWQQPLPLCTSCLREAAAPGTLAACSGEGCRWSLLLLMWPLPPLLPPWLGLLALLHSCLIRITQDSWFSSGECWPVCAVHLPCCLSVLGAFEHLLCWLCGCSRICAAVHTLRLLAQLGVRLANCCWVCRRR